MLAGDFSPTTNVKRAAGRLWYNLKVLAEESGVNPELPRNGDVRQ